MISRRFIPTSTSVTYSISLRQLSSAKFTSLLSWAKEKNLPVLTNVVNVTESMKKLFGVEKKIPFRGSHRENVVNEVVRCFGHAIHGRNQGQYFTDECTSRMNCFCEWRQWIR